MFVCINRLKCQRAEDDVGEREKLGKTAEKKEEARRKKMSKKQIQGRVED